MGGGVSANGGIHVVSDNDLFKVAARPRAPVRLQGLNKQQPRKVSSDGWPDSLHAVS